MTDSTNYTDDTEIEPGQIEVNAGPSLASLSPTAMNDATEAAIRALGDGATPDEATIEEARGKAEEILKGMSQTDADGLKDLQNLTLSLGLPSARATFRHMIVASGVAGQKKNAAMQFVADLSPLTEVGCHRIDFTNQKSGVPDVAYIRIFQCPKPHNLGNQLDKMKGIVPAAHWPELMKSISSLIQTARNVYGTLTRQNLPFIRSLFKLAEDDPCADYIDYKVDMALSNLYINDKWPNRIGVFITLDGEIKAEEAAKKARVEASTKKKVGKSAK
jgi:hypothetical protein